MAYAIVLAVKLAADAQSTSILALAAVPCGAGSGGGGVELQRKQLHQVVRTRPLSEGHGQCSCSRSTVCPKTPPRKPRSFAAVLGVRWIYEVSLWLLLTRSVDAPFHPILGTMKSYNFLPTAEH